MRKLQLLCCDAHHYYGDARDSQMWAANELPSSFLYVLRRRAGPAANDLS
jgi:hypothetical protein